MNRTLLKFKHRCELSAAKRILFVFTATLLLAAMATSCNQGQQPANGSLTCTSAEKEEITRTLEIYMEGNRQADRNILSEVFAETATVSTAMNGTFSNRSIQSFYTILEGAGPGPGSYTLTACHVEKDIAMLRVELELGDHQYTDMLNLVKDGNEWKIVNKTSHRHY